MSYGNTLVWLENALNDFDDHKNGVRSALMQMDLGAEKGERAPTKDEVGLSYRYRFPVHACGYNWLASNLDSAKRLGERIDQIIERYRLQQQKVEKVILVTHSMGGLVARCCSEVLGYKSKILGVVHGVMPAIGAAAVYRRFKSGTENPGKGFKQWAAGKAASEILGGDAAEMTAVLSSAPGPLQLLPTVEYGNGWLQIEDGGKTHALPQNGDPYSEIYTVRGRGWSMCEDHLMNPLNKEISTPKYKEQQDRDWDSFDEIIYKYVKSFHKGIEKKYHQNTYAFYGSSNSPNSFGNVVWRTAPEAPLEDALNARAVNPRQVKEQRSVDPSSTPESSQRFKLTTTFTLAGPDESGDGTVPLRSGVAAQPFSRSVLQVQVEHEPAYNPEKGADNLRACHFTVRAIVQIAQSIQETSLRYE